MLDKVARLPGAPCLLAQGTRLGGVAFYHVNGSCRTIPANRGEINRKNMVARGEFFRNYHLPVLSARTKWQSIWRDQCNRRVSGREQARPMPMQEAEIDGKKFPSSAVIFVVLSGHSKDNSRSPLTVLVRRVACKGGLCFTPSSRVAWLARAPSLHVNRPLNNLQFPP